MVEAACIGRIKSPSDLLWLADLGHIRGLASTARKADWASLVRFPLVEGSCVGRHVGHLQLRLRRGTKTRRTADEVPLCPGHLSGPDSLPILLNRTVLLPLADRLSSLHLSTAPDVLYPNENKSHRRAKISLSPRDHRHSREVTRLRAQLRASDSNELDERQGFHQARDCFDSAFRSAASLSAISLRSSL